jgi:predicted cobalt transporter CbtA
MLAGLLAGLCAIAFAKLVAEPQISKAEHFEKVMYAQAGQAAGKPLVARDVQDTLGLGVGVALTGVALGGLFGLAFAAVYRRFGQTGARATAGGLAAAAFVAIFAIPFLKYPANPPSVGRADTIGRRTALYFVIMAVGIVAVIVGAVVRRRLCRSWRPWDASLAAAALVVAIVVAADLLMPGIDEVPALFPASVLWKFRLASAGTEIVLWAVLGLVFGWLTERAEAAVLSERGRAGLRSP